MRRAKVSTSLRRFWPCKTKHWTSWWILPLRLLSIPMPTASVWRGTRFNGPIWWLTRSLRGSWYRNICLNWWKWTLKGQEFQFSNSIKILLASKSIKIILQSKATLWYTCQRQTRKWWGGACMGWTPPTPAWNPELDHWHLECSFILQQSDLRNKETGTK